MTDTPTRVVALVCILLGAWVIAYWLYQPKAAPRITLDQTPAIFPASNPMGRAGGIRAMPDTASAANPPVVESLPPQLAPPPAKPAEVLKPQRTRRVQKILPPEFREYTVRKGDTSYEKIAARKEVFGDARKATAIAKSNPLADPAKLKPGVTVLKIPVDPDNIQGKPVWVEEPIADSDASGGGQGQTDIIHDPTMPPPPAPSPASTPGAAPVKTYTIQPDDTLWDIAKRFYGSGAKWKLIAEANKDVLPNPDRPGTGVTIRIPAEP